MKKSIFIELTPLLDVILILLFVTITTANAGAESARAAADEASLERDAALTELADAGVEIDGMALEIDALTDENAALSYENEGLRRDLLTDGIITENSLLITLAVEYGDSGTRRILVSTDGDEIANIQLEWDGREEASNALRTALYSLIDAEDPLACFIVFQYDRAVIFQSDYRLVINAVQSQFSAMSSVFLIQYDIRDSDH